MRLMTSGEIKSFKIIMFGGEYKREYYKEVIIKHFRVQKKNMIFVYQVGINMYVT